MPIYSIFRPPLTCAFTPFRSPFYFVLEVPEYNGKLPLFFCPNITSNQFNRLPSNNGLIFRSQTIELVGRVKQSNYPSNSDSGVRRGREERLVSNRVFLAPPSEERLVLKWKVNLVAAGFGSLPVSFTAVQLGRSASNIRMGRFIVL